VRAAARPRGSLARAHAGVLTSGAPAGPQATASGDQWRLGGRDDPAVGMRWLCLSDLALRADLPARLLVVRAGQRPVEAYRCLVALPVFKTGEAEDLGLAGSIPVRLRQRLPRGLVPLIRRGSLS
jgi:hypothetical protein